ncbi:MAG: EAL domain-containing protein [Gammaproteobacteria bacterium]|nr:EAL domain-containing protein [Gammaproteobacteria bacterium]
MLLALALVLGPGLGWCGSLAASPPDSPRFEHLGSREGLTQNTVNTLFQDSHGILWVGTQGGLHRYDGNSFQVYLHEPDNPHSLSDSYVTQIAEDARGNLWIGTLFGGLNRLDLASRRFQHIGQLQGLGSDLIHSLQADGGRLWVGHGAGLDAIDTQTLAITRAAEPELHEPATALARLPDGSLAIGTQNGRLWQRLPDGRLKPLASLPPATRINALAVDGPDRLWFAAGPELWLHLLSGGETKAYWRADAAEGQSISALQPDPVGRLWLSGPALGLVGLHIADPELPPLRYHHHPEQPDSLGNDHTRSLLLDRSGVLWLGSNFAGLDKLALSANQFQRLLDTSPGLSRLTVNNVRSVRETRDGRLWIGTEGAGLKSWGAGDSAYRYHNDLFAKATGIPEAKLGLRVFALREQADETLWIGTNLGLARWRRPLAPGVPADFRLFRHRDGQTGSLPADFVRRLMLDRQGRIWAGTDAGLARYQPQTEDFQHIPVPQPKTQATSALVLTMNEDVDGSIWVGTVNGLELYDPVSGAFRSFRHRMDAKDSLSDNRVRSIHLARDKTLWIGTHSGLNQLLRDHRGDHRFRHYLSQEGLANDTIYGILEDSQGRLWLSTNRGISRFEPETGRFRQYDERDGLQGAEFNGGAAYASPSGELYFGGIAGLNRFRPEAIADSQFRPPILLTALRVGNRRTALSDPRPPAEIRVDYADRILGLEFAALDYGAPERNRYAYRLEGFDKDWIDNGNKRELTYTNLDPGGYRLLIKASNKDGIWNETPLSVPLYVIPPWYRTPLAYGGYALVLAGFGGYLAWARHRKHLAQARATAAIAESEERLQLALWGSGDGLWDWNIQSGYVYRQGLDFLQYADDEIAPSVDGMKSLIHPDDRLLYQSPLDAHLRGDSDYYEAEYRLRARDGQWHWIQDRGKIVERDASGQPLRIAGTHKDITARKLVEKDLRLAAQVLSDMAEAVVVADLEFRIVAVNPAFTRITGYQAQETQGRDVDFLNSPRHEPEFYDNLRRTLNEKHEWHGEIWQRHKNGHDVLMDLELNLVQESNGRHTHIVGVFSDITERKRAEEELRFLANYDTLTTLPNRTLFQERLRHALSQAKRQKHYVALLFLDLDRFKHINDSLGHHVGDLLLQEVARRLGLCVREDDTVARLGGDEFTIIVEALHNAKAATVVAEKVLAKFKQPFLLEGREVVVSPSIGISIYPSDGEDAASLVKFADSAMYHAKELGRNNFQFYTQELNAYAMRRMQLETALRRAMESDEFRLVFQPKVAVDGELVTGVETLVRWDSQEVGAVSPMEFIPLAEETGLIVPLGEWVLRRACQQYMTWRALGLSGFTIAVNLSARQFHKGDVSGVVQKILADCEMPAECLELELTESVVMEKAEASITMLNQLKAMGLKLSVDDFGTGYSSLSYLKRFPIDTLKIDREFVRDISSDPEDAAITSAIITLAHTLNLRVVAEGVENLNQLEFLKARGCDEIQGYYFSRPLDAEACEEFLRRHGAAGKTAV